MNIELSALTERELSILIELLKGKTNEEIGGTFTITKHTVKAHIKSILQKTNLKHRCQLISCVLTNLSQIDISSPETKISLHNLALTQK